MKCNIDVCNVFLGLLLLVTSSSHVRGALILEGSTISTPVPSTTATPTNQAGVETTTVTTATTTTIATTTTTLATATATTTLATSTLPSSTESAAPRYSEGCNLRKSSTLEKKLSDKLQNLKQKQFTWEDDEHRYYFGVCSQANNSINKDDGLIQINKKTNKIYVIGRLSDVDIEGDDNFIRVNYKGGDRYQNACKKTERNAAIYLMCNNQNNSEIFQMIEENNDRDQDCFYVFKVLTASMCSSNISNCTSGKPAIPDSSSSKSKWGIFSIIFVIIGSLMLVYMIIGTIYLRFVQQARGFEQIPHWRLWNNIGNRSADCCNYFCRCGYKPTPIHSYENINDRMSDDDENLLNM